MQTITRQEVIAFQKDLEATIKPLLEKYNVTRTRTSGKYDTTGFSVKLEFLRAGAEQDAAAAKHNDYLGSRFGIKVGDTVTNTSGKTYTITGATARSEKFPLTGKTADGKNWRISEKGLKLADGSALVDKWAMPIGGDDKPRPVVR